MKIAGDTARVSPVFYLHSALGGTGPQLFFALSATYAAMVLILWVVIYRLQPVAALPPVLWHAHEMLFGVAAAGLAGLAYGLAPPRLHAPPASGVRVAVPALIWLLGRVAMAATGVVPSWLAALTDLAFIPVFAALVIMPGFATRPRRNLALLALFGGLWLGDLAMHAAALGTGLGLADWGARLAVHLYMLAIAVIGGAAIPVLTNRALRGSGVAITVPAMRPLDVLAIGALGLYVACDAIFGPGLVAGLAALAAAGCGAVRLVLWRGYCVPRAPSVWILHLAYLWLVLGLFLAAAVPLAGAVADMASIHVMTAGAIGTGLIGLISWTGLAANRHVPAVGPVMVAAYVLVTLAAALRVAALFVPGEFANLVLASAAVWALAFVVFLIAYLPGVMLPRRPRLDLDQGASRDAGQ